jgi:hypothetical protein
MRYQLATGYRLSPTSTCRVACLFLLLPTLASAQTFEAPGIRAQGMGGAFVAVADDASAAYWNPAGIATGATFDLQISGGRSTLFAGAVTPVLGFSYYRIDHRSAPELPTVSPPPNRQTEGSGVVDRLTLTTTNFGVTIVQTIVPGLVIGATTRMVRGAFEALETTTTVDFDAGAMVSVGSVRVGIVGRNMREPEFESDAEPMKIARHFRLGAALAPRSLPSGIHGPFSIAFDADVTRPGDAAGRARTAAAGTEYWLWRGRIGARTGLRWQTEGEANRAWSVGATARLRRSIFVEGQLTDPAGPGEREWAVGARVTF